MNVVVFFYFPFRLRNTWKTTTNIALKIKTFTLPYYVTYRDFIFVHEKKKISLNLKENSCFFIFILILQNNPLKIVGDYNRALSQLSPSKAWFFTSFS